MSDGSNRYKNELINLIRLIMFRGITKETLQVEAMRFLRSDTSFFAELISATIGTSNNDVNDAHKNVTVIDTEQSHSEKIETIEEVKCTHTGSIERTKRVSETVRKSKYEGIDFSHIHREPKRSKRKRNKHVQDGNQDLDKNSLLSSKMNDNSTTFRMVEDGNNIDFIRSIFQMLFDTASKGEERRDSDFGTVGSFKRSQLHAEKEGKSDVCKNERDEKMDVGLEKDEESSIENGKTTSPYVKRNGERNVTASTLMNKLIHSKSKEEQENVLKSLRSDESLRKIFIKEASSHKGLRIPVFHASKCSDVEKEGHGQSYDHCRGCQKSNKDLPLDETPTQALGTTDQAVVNETQMGSPASHTEANENTQFGIAMASVITTPSSFWHQDESKGRNDFIAKTNTFFTDTRSTTLQNICDLDPYMLFIDDRSSGVDENPIVEFYQE